MNQSKDNSTPEKDLAWAIKQIAKEMADAMKTPTKDISKETIINTEVLPTQTYLEHNEEYDNDDDEREVEIEQTEPKGERFNRSNNRYQNSNEFQEFSNTKSHYEKEVNKYNNTQLRLELMRTKKITEEMKKYSDNKPKICNQSKKIIKAKLSNEKPIFMRADEIVRNKITKIEMLKNVYKEFEIMQELDFQSRFNSSQVVDKKVVDNFINEQYIWQKNKEDKLFLMKSEIDILEEEAERSLYKPTILKTSENIAMNKISKEKEKQVHNRLFNLHEEKELKKKNNINKLKPSFIPTINRGVPNYGKKEVEVRRDSTPVGVRNNNISMVNTTQIGVKSKKQNLNNSAIEMENKKIENNFYQYVNFYEDDFFNVNGNKVNQSLKKIEKTDKTTIKKKYSIIQNQNDKRQTKTGSILADITKDMEENSLYKLNVRNNSPWNKIEENKITIAPKFSLNKKIK